MEPWSTLGHLLTQATLSTQPNLFKEALGSARDAKLDPPLCGPFPGISVLENAKERPSAWPSVVFMEPWRTLGPLLTQATHSTRPNLFKEAPSVGQRRKTGPPLCGPFPVISVLENAKERPSAWPCVVFYGAMEHPRPSVNSGNSFDPTNPLLGSAFGRPETQNWTPPLRALSGHFGPQKR